MTSKLEDLIAELCPNGVEYKVLGELCNICTGKLNANAKDEDGIYPFFTCDANPYKINEYAFDTSAILISGNGSQVGHLNQYEGKFNAYQRTCVLDNFKLVIKPFLFHFMDAYLKPYIMVNCKKGSVPYITLPMLQSFNVPVPPLEVQREIVRILDSFTLLTAELTAELTARKKQYEYYRDTLLTFNDNNPLHSLISRYSPNGVDKIKLNEICTIYDGTHSTPQYKEFGVKFVSVENINDLYSTTKYISEEDFDKYKIKPQIGDVFMTRIGSIGICNVVDRDEKLAYYVSLALLRPNTAIINSRYLKYAIESIHGRKELRKRTLVNAVPIKINKDDIGKVQLPVPSLEVQREIVRILDNFTELTAELTENLTAELTACKKQYEYYRDQLLTFKRA